jgi:hypothetical protein
MKPACLSSPWNWLESEACSPSEEAGKGKNRERRSRVKAIIAFFLIPLLNNMPGIEHIKLSM